MPLLLLIMEGFVFLAVIAAGIRALWKWKKQGSAYGTAGQLRRCRGRVLRKDVGSSADYSMSRGYMNQSTDFSITFDVEGEGTLVLLCGADLFQLAERGQSGRIVFRGNRLMNFEED